LTNVLNQALDDRQRPPYAGFWWRFLATFIDGFIMLIPECAIGASIGLVLGGVLYAQGYDKQIINAVAQASSGLLGIVLRWLYFALFEASDLQATPGKLACGLKVTDLNGNRISFARASGRYWGKILSGCILLIGYIMAAFTERKQALHDIMAGTLVLKKQSMGGIPEP
jgi:uncharacterized RDD family membrane protein YckC